MGIVCLLGVFVALTSAGCGTAVSDGPNLTIHIVGNPLGNPDSFYKPRRITISIGTTVTWVDRDDSIHTVTPDTNYPGWSGGSGDLSTGQKYSHLFKRAGRYTYHCMVHPDMIGVVIVNR